MKREDTDTNQLSFSIIQLHHTNRFNFLQFLSQFEKKSHQENKGIIRNYFFLNWKIVLFLIVLKIFDILTTHIGLSTGLARESNAFVIPLLDNLVLLYLISFFPMVGLSLLNFYVFKAERLSLLKLITVSGCFLAILLIITVVNNIIVINFALL